LISICLKVDQLDAAYLLALVHFHSMRREELNQAERGKIAMPRAGSAFCPPFCFPFSTGDASDLLIETLKTPFLKNRGAGRFFATAKGIPRRWSHGIPVPCTLCAREGSILSREGESMNAKTSTLIIRSEKIEGVLTNDSQTYRFSMEGAPTPYAEVQLVLENGVVPRGQWALGLKLSPSEEWIVVDIIGEDEWMDGQVRGKRPSA
jgi:hypothetical protein